MKQYTHRYSLTAADMDTRYRMTPNAVLLYYQDCWARYMSCLHLAAFDVIKENRIWVITEFNAWFEDQTAFWSDDIEVTVWNSEISALRLYAEFGCTGWTAWRWHTVSVAGHCLTQRRTAWLR